MTWNTTKLITVGSLAVLGLLVWIPSSLVSTVSGSIFGGILHLFFGAFFAVLSVFLVREFGTVALRAFIGETLGLPLPHVIPIAFTYLHVVRGFISDLLFFYFKAREKLAAILIGGVENFLLIFETYIILKITGLPMKGNIPSIMLTPVGLLVAFVLIFIIGSLSGLVGYFVYNKIKNTNVVKRIQGTND